MFLCPDTTSMLLLPQSRYLKRSMRISAWRVTPSTPRRTPVWPTMRGSARLHLSQLTRLTGDLQATGLLTLILLQRVQNEALRW